MRRLGVLILALVGLTVTTATDRALAAGLATSRDTSPRSVSSSFWSIQGSTVRVRVTLSAAEVRDLGPIGGPAPTLSAIAAAVGAGVSVSAEGQDCPAIDQGEGVGIVYTLALTPGARRFEMVFRCPRADRVTLHDRLLFDRAPDHRNYALIQVGGRRPALRIFTAGRQDVSLPAGILSDAGAPDFAIQGLWRSVSRFESLCAIAGLLLLSRRWRDIGVIAGGLGAGYAASLAASLAGLAATPASVETGAAVLIALLGVSALYGRVTEGKVGARWRVVGLAVAGLTGFVIVVAAALIERSAGLVVGGLLLFGLALMWSVREGAPSALPLFAFAAAWAVLDGTQPAVDLQPLHLTRLRLAPLVSAYDFGGGLGLLAVLAAVMAALRLVARKAGSLRLFTEDFVGAGVLGFGVFWFVTGLYSL